MPADVGLADERGVVLSGLRRGVAHKRDALRPWNQGCSPRFPPVGEEDPDMEVMIGIDPHKGSRTATMLDRRQRELKQVTVRAGRRQVVELLEWADGVRPRTWAVESAGGMGYLLAQQLVAAGERVVDVPATLAARVRCWAPGSRPRPIRTTPARWQWPRCMPRRWRWCARLITSRCAACWPSGTPMWPVGGPNCAVSCTLSSLSWCRAGSTKKWSSPRHDRCWTGSRRLIRRRSSGTARRRARR